MKYFHNESIRPVVLQDHKRASKLPGKLGSNTWLDSPTEFISTSGMRPHTCISNKFLGDAAVAGAAGGHRYAVFYRSDR